MNFSVCLRLLRLIFFGSLLFNFSLTIAGHMVFEGSRSISTAYLPIDINQYSFDLKQRGHGGALAGYENLLVLGTSQRTFLLINPETFNYQVNFLPEIFAGEDDLKRSLRYLGQELAPRIEDLLYSDGNFYVSYTRYDVLDDFIKFVIAKSSASKQGWGIIYESIGLDAPYYPLGTG
jgi:hypothetical protein